MALQVDVEGDERLRRKLSGATGLMRNLKPPLKKVARTLRRRTDKQFRTRGSAFGSGWDPRSSWTVKARQAGWGYYGAKGARGGTLEASGETRSSFTERSDPKHVEEIGRQSMTWGSKHPLSHLHAQGPSNRGPAPALPQREIIAFKSENEKTELFREPIAEHVLEDLADGR